MLGLLTYIRLGKVKKAQAAQLDASLADAQRRQREFFNGSSRDLRGVYIDGKPAQK